MAGDKKILWNKANERIEKYEINSELFNTLIAYFRNENSKFNHKKGLLITGTVGSGKTSLMQIFSDWISEVSIRLFKNGDMSDEQIAKDNLLVRKQFRIVPIRKMERDYNVSGYEGIDYYGFNTKTNKFGIKEDKPKHICIDDVGTEREIVKNYANGINIFSELILDRYTLWRDYGIYTHITTNLPLAKIEERYDSRVFSRITEMFEVVQLIKPDYRKREKDKSTILTFEV